MRTRFHIRENIQHYSSKLYDYLPHSDLLDGLILDKITKKTPPHVVNSQALQKPIPIPESHANEESVEASQIHDGAFVEEPSSVLPASPKFEGPVPETTVSTDASEESPILASIDYEHLFALIIGIDNYQSYRPTGSDTDPRRDRVSSLHGAVADAAAVFQFLTARGVPETNIVKLEDEAATGEEIKKQIEAFATNDSIKKGDPIVIYYAGHGSETDRPTSWLSEGEDKVQMLLPSDFDPRVKNPPGRAGQGIFDRTLSALLRRVATAKGNNIVVILDSCHSASGTRDSLDDLQRGHLLHNDYRIYDQLDDELLSKLQVDEEKNRDDGNLGNLAFANMRSHVLLAACEKGEKATEHNGRGNFTMALLEYLGKSDLAQATYDEVIQNLPKLPNQQTPRCEGVHQHRLFFRSRIPPRSAPYPVKIDKDTLIINSGEASGITLNSTFKIHAHPEPGPELAKAKVVGLGPFSTKLKCISNARIFDIEKKYYAQLWGRDPSVRILVDAPTGVTLKLDEQGRSADESLWDATFVTKETENYDLKLVRTKDPDTLKFTFHDTILQEHGLAETHAIAVENSAESADIIQRLLGAACHFYAHLRARNEPTVLTPTKQPAKLASRFQIDFSVVEEVLDDNLNLFYCPFNGENLYKGEAEKIDVAAYEVDENGKPPEAALTYGLKITNTSPVAFYVWVFFFNCKSMSINLWYGPNGEKEPHHCLERNGKSIMIGCDSSPEPPRIFTLQKGDKRDVGFLKILFSTKYVNFTAVKQDNPFVTGTQRGSTTRAPGAAFNFWASKCIPIIQTDSTLSPR